MTGPTRDDDDEPSAGALSATSDLPPEVLQDLAKREHDSKRGLRWLCALFGAGGFALMVLRLGSGGAAHSIDVKFRDMGLNIKTEMAGLIVIVLAIVVAGVFGRPSVTVQAPGRAPSRTRKRRPD